MFYRRRWRFAVALATAMALGVGTAQATTVDGEVAGNTETPELPAPGSGWTRTDALGQQPRAPQNWFGGRNGGGFATSQDAVAGGSIGDDRFGTDAGSVTVSRRTPLGWTTQVLQSPTPATGGAFGTSLAMAHDTLAVSAPGEAGGQVHLFRLNDIGSFQLAQTLSGTGRFGHQVAMAGPVLVVGAPGVDKAMVYERSASQVWELGATLSANDGAGNFGASVAVDAPEDLWSVPVPAWVAVGDDQHRHGSSGVTAGAVNIFVRQPEGWTWAQEVTSPLQGTAAQFGRSVDLAGELMAVGAPAAGAAGKKGAVYLYTLSGGVWTFADTIRPAKDTRPEYFGADVDVGAGWAVAVGAPATLDGRALGGPGAVYVFAPTPTGFARHSLITPPGGRPGDGFGSSVQLEPNRLWASAPFRDQAKGLLSRFVPTSCCDWPKIHYVTGSRSAPPSQDRVLVERLRNNHIRVELIDDDALVAPGPGVAAVLISSSVAHDKIGRFYRHVAVPVVTWEPYLYDDLGFTDGRSASQGETTGSYTSVADTNPMNIGYETAGPITTSPLPLSFARLGGEPRVYATVAGQPDRAVMFAYEKGMALADGTPAPELRFGLFLTYRTPSQLTGDHWWEDYWPDQTWFTSGGWGRVDSVIKCTLYHSNIVEWWECFDDYGTGPPT